MWQQLFWLWEKSGPFFYNLIISPYLTKKILILGLKREDSLRVIHHGVFFSTYNCFRVSRVSILMGLRGSGVYVEKNYKEGMYRCDPSHLYFSQPIVSRISTCTGITWGILLRTDPEWGLWPKILHFPQVHKWCWCCWWEDVQWTHRKLNPSYFE